MDVTLSDPILLYNGDPRFLDSIFNISSLGIDTNVLLFAGGVLILGFVLFGRFLISLYVSLIREKKR